MIKEFDVAFIKSEFEKKNKIFLLACGQMATNIAASNAPVDTGALKNSIGYKMINDNVVQVGSNLNYAAVQEKKRGYMVKALDEMERTGIKRIAEKVFQW